MSSENNKKRLLVLGGIAQQNKIIKEAQEIGYHVIVIDFLEDSPGKKIADESYLISITDVDSIIKLCKEIIVDGVMNYCIDPGQKPYQQICERLNLYCYGTKEQFDILSNKDLFKAECIKNGVDVIPGYKINKNYSIEEINNIKLPVVVKPADSRASKGITICKNKKDLPKAIDFALGFSQRKIVNIEQYLNKPELCAKYFVCNGEIYLTAFSDTHTHYDDGKRVYICGKTYPSQYYSIFKETADKKVREMIKNIGIKNGPLSFTGFFDNGLFRFFDPSFRMGGGQEWSIIKNITGVDISKCLTNFAITGSMGFVENLRKLDHGFASKHAAALQLLIKPGTIRKIHGVDNALMLKSVVSHHISHTIGDTISGIGTSDSVFMRVLLVGDSKEKLLNDQLQIEKTIKVLDKKNKNLGKDLDSLKNRFEKFKKKKEKHKKTEKQSFEDNKSFSELIGNKQRKQEYENIMLELDNREKYLNNLEENLKKDKIKVNEQVNEFKKWREKLESLEQEIENRKKDIMSKEKLVKDTIESSKDLVVDIKTEEKVVTYHDLLDKIPDSAVVIHRGILKQINDSFADLIGYNVDEILNKSLFDFIIPEELSDVKNYYINKLTGIEVTSFETTLLSKENDKISVEINTKPTDFKGKKAEIAVIKKIKSKKEEK